VADELKTCPSCSHTQATGAFCEACGTKLPDVAAAAPTPPPPPVAAPTPPPAPMAAPFAPPPPVAQPAPPVQPQYAPGAPPYPGAYPVYPPAPSPFMEYLAFRKMLIPGIAVVAFWLFEGINLFYWIRMIYYTHHSALEVIFSLAGLCVTALLIRVFMETVITVFKNKS
jgi:hypothetical protein